MKKVYCYLLSCLIAVLLVSELKAQTVSTVDSLNAKYLNWYNLDFKANKIVGTSADKAYKEVLKGKTPKKKIIVAVIDGGVDTAHIELKGKMWKNPKEIAGNGIDDDKNGYVDDIFGWNFIGNSKGENISTENLEYTRVMKKLGPVYKAVKSKEVIAPTQENEYNMYLLAKEKYNEELENYKTSKKRIETYEDGIDDAEGKLKLFLKKTELTEKDIEDISSSNDDIKKAKEYLQDLSKRGISRASLKAGKDYVNTYLDKYLNLEYDARAIIGDNTEDINDTKYGNNNVKGPDAGHGTLVAGVIAANRNNNTGIEGIADNVEIMAIRVVPDGDERDKDVALGIRYAVDNGANIINMSFGKAFSPQKKFVDEALLYAEKHNVLLVHAAGNDGQNNDSIEHYPTKIMDDGTIVKTMLNIGASNLKKDKEYAAKFSNYGQSVDLFAPGVNIISLAPENKYTKANGTSFSCPVVSGVAALVWSYYPELTALQLKDVLINSVSSQAKWKVNQPWKGKKNTKVVSFNALCKTGGTINAYNALKAAEKLAGWKK